MLPERPITRLETYLAQMAGQDVAIPETPISRIECYLQYICEHGGGGGGGGDDSKVYGFHINGADSDPSSAVTYLRDAAGLTPAHMDYATGTFDYGSWEDAFFMPRPCMLRSDGTVAYYLDPSDYSKKSDGSASDIADTTFSGNAMMEWGRDGRRIWYKIVPDAGDPSSASVYIAPRQVDAGYKAYSFYNNSGEMTSHFYTPIYNGSLINDGERDVLRSLSGQALPLSITGPNQISAAQANNPTDENLWYIETLADRMLINILLILMGKSLDTQTVFGWGLTTGGQTALESYRTGALNASGLFAGYDDGAHAVKIFGMENWWGAQWRRTAGLIMNGGAMDIKMTYGTQDGSTVDGYNAEGTGYISTGISPSGTSGGYIDVSTFNEYGMFGANSTGTSSTFFCDGQWFNASGARYALFGGASSSGAICGAFACHLSYALSFANVGFGACLSCKPKGA